MEQETTPQSAPRGGMGIPGAIVLAGAIIALAIFMSRSDKSASSPAELPEDSAPVPLQTISVRTVGANDHIRGNPEAKVVIYEYSDTECPFCKTFHMTMKQVVNEYGKSGQVAWVYRHLPLTQIHPKAPKEAEATECAAELGGNAKYWEYIDLLFEKTPSNNGLNLSDLPKFARTVGLNEEAFNECLSSGRHAGKVSTDAKEAVSAGANGTPFNVFGLSTPLKKQAEDALNEFNRAMLLELRPGSAPPVTISSDKKFISVSGAFPLELMKQIIDVLLK